MNHINLEGQTTKMFPSMFFFQQMSLCVGSWLNPKKYFRILRDSPIWKSFLGICYPRSFSRIFCRVFKSFAGSVILRCISVLRIRLQGVWTLWSQILWGPRPFGIWSNHLRQYLAPRVKMSLNRVKSRPNSKII